MINNISYIQTNNNIQPGVVKAKNVAFKGYCPETLKYTNIGSCLEGYIGKVKLRRAENNGDYYANVFKKYIGNNAERYSLCNEFGDVIGEADIFIKKFLPGSYDPIEYKEDPSHVFVDNLRNYTNPNTPYYKKGLEYFKDIGTRLLQIAQRRSDEAQCMGNVKLISKGESKNWYKNVIGMVEESHTQPNNLSFLRCSIYNPNSLVLPPHAKEPLSRLQGGL